MNEQRLLAFLIPLPDEKKNELKFLFSHFFVVTERLYEGLGGLHETLWGTTKKCENKILS